MVDTSGSFNYNDPVGTSQQGLPPSVQQQIAALQQQNNPTYMGQISRMVQAVMQGNSAYQDALKRATTAATGSAQPLAGAPMDITAPAQNAPIDQTTTPAAPIQPPVQAPGDPTAQATPPVAVDPTQQQQPVGVDPMTAALMQGPPITDDSGVGF